jgi:hypothetical protein
MNCTFHPTQVATARCAACQRQLCPACDHRIKGTPYCQDCIVAGVEMLRRQPAAAAKVEGHAPLVAALFALIPGLGAAYNGQNIKSLVHFIIPVSLWQLGDIFSRGIEVPFFLSGTVFYLFSIYDAVRTAKRARAGADLQVEDEALKKLLRENTTIWGALLVSVGALSLVDLFFPFLLHRFWPVLLILAGLLLLRTYQRPQQAQPIESALPAQPPSVIGTPYERFESNLLKAERRFDQWR